MFLSNYSALINCSSKALIENTTDGQSIIFIFGIFSRLPEYGPQRFYCIEPGMIDHEFSVKFVTYSILMR